ncbi:MAG TPA: class III extradiol ring-cleavage dioxygenase [Holophagaceae bacterium]|nr:class III extradiol ring-cleavage dioxygenase [Holophagaceae bacterium]
MRSPVLFVSHGSPMLALDSDHAWARALHAYGRSHGAKAILVVSAHWWTPDLRITTTEQPVTIHDFSGFPEALYRLAYPASGSPALAGRAMELLRVAGLPVEADPNRGLDHGAWSVLRHSHPEADLPVVQLSLPRWEPAALLKVGEALAPLRAEGVLIVASGGLIHNLRAVDWDAPDDAVRPWADEAEAWFARHLDAGDTEALLDHRTRWAGSHQAAPTPDHLDPVFVAIGAAQGDPHRTVYQGFQLGTLSLRTWSWEAP